MVMNTEGSRRSACDRCRDQKLRCVRTSYSGDSPWVGPLDLGDNQLPPCERCVKAGVNCLNAFTPRSKLFRTGNFRTLASLSGNLPSERSPPPSLFPFGMDHGPTATSDARSSESPMEGSYSTSILQQRTNFEEQFEEKATKRVLKEVDSNHLETTAQHGSPTFDRYTATSNGRDTSDSNSRQTALSDVPSFSAATSPTSKRHKSFSVDSFDFRTSPASNGYHRSGPILVDNMFIGGEATNRLPSDNPIVERALSFSERLGAQAMDTNEECLYQLSELSSTLMKDCSSAKLWEDLSFSRCSNQGGSNFSARTAESTNPKNTIGRVLESSQTFLGILQHLKPNQPSPGTSDCSYSEYWDENEFISITNDPYFPNGTLLASGSATHRSMEDANAEGTRSNSSFTADVPTTLTIITCYIYLLQKYDAIFSGIYNMLVSQAGVSPQAMPAIVPGLHIGGFSLDDHKDLQIDILIQVSSRMLERIEETLGVCVMSSQETRNNSTCGHGILETTSASALLDIMFKQNDIGCLNGDNGRVARVKQTMNNVRGLLKGRAS